GPPGDGEGNGDGRRLLVGGGGVRRSIHRRLPQGRDPVTSPALLEVRGVTKRFGSVHALGGVDLDCGAGEVVALVGDNGAGKSTLVKIISGAVAPDRGTVRLDGTPIPPGPEAAAGLGVGTVYQDLALCDNLD